MSFAAVPISRRAFAQRCAAAPALLLGCKSATAPVIVANSARLSARWSAPTTTITPQTWTLRVGDRTVARLLVPSGYDPAVALPLIVAFHGAVGDAQDMIDFLGPDAASRHYFVLAIQSTLTTWDAIGGQFGADVTATNSALGYAFTNCRVDSTRIIAAGFSDGASYALGLGRCNGDLFRKVVAFSPGFVPESSSAPVGKPPIFVSHGTADAVFPIDATSRVIVPRLRAEGYSVEYREFAGGHGVPAEVGNTSRDWMLA